MTSSTCPKCDRPVIEAVSQRRPILLEPLDPAVPVTHFFLLEDGVASRTLYRDPSEEAFVEHRCPRKAAA